MFAEVNFLHVLLAGIAALVVGVIWYMPPIMGKRWANYVNQYVGIPEGELLAPGNPLRQIGSWLLTTLTNALIVAYLFQKAGIDNTTEAIGAALAVWLGVGLTFSSWPVIFARQSAGLWLVNNGAFLLMQLAIAVVLIVLQ